TIHVMNSADPKTANLLKSSGKVNIVSAHGGGLYSFPMRCDTPPFDDNDLRLALKNAIDRDALVKRLAHQLISGSSMTACHNPSCTADDRGNGFTLFTGVMYANPSLDARNPLPALCRQLAVSLVLG